MPLVLVSVILELDLALKKNNFFNLVRYKVLKFQLNILRVERAFCINQYLLKVYKLMNKDLAQNKVYNYFNIGDAKTLIEINEK